MEKTHSLYGLRIALLIDFDNVILGVDDPPGFDVELVVNALRSRGSVVLGRAYGDWYRHHRHRRKLMEQGIELVETPVFGPLIKNSADIRIVLDGFEIAMQQSHIDTFCLVSGDSDFLPLIKKLQYLGKQVIVIAGTKFTSELVRRNCNEYVSYENLLAESVGADEDATTLDGALHLLQRTIVNLHELGMEVRSSTVKQMMVQLNPVFSERNFGFSQFKQFLDKAVKAGLISLGRRDTLSGEYTVFLSDEGMSGDVAETSTQSTPASNGTAARPSRRRSSRTRKTKAEAEAETADETVSAPVETLSTPEDEDEESRADDSSASSESERLALRRGRLRFSGRTWKSGATRSAEPTTAETGDAPVEEPSDETFDEATPPVSEETAETTPEETSDEAKTSDDTQTEPEAEVKEEKPARKRTSRGGRKRKTEATPDAKETDADATKDEAKPADGEAKPSDGETQVDEEATEKKPAAKRTRTRRTTRKKAADAESSETPATEETSSQAESSGEAKTSDEAESSDSTEGEEKPKRKTTRRRRTTRKKAEEKTDE